MMPNQRSNARFFASSNIPCKNPFMPARAEGIQNREPVFDVSRLSTSDRTKVYRNASQDCGNRKRTFSTTDRYQQSSSCSRITTTYSCNYSAPVSRGGVMYKESAKPSDHASNQRLFRNSYSGMESGELTSKRLEGPSNKKHKSEESLKSATSKALLDEPKWMYRNHLGNMSGPYSFRQLLEGFQSKFLPPELDIHKACNGMLNEPVALRQLVESDQTATVSNDEAMASTCKKESRWQGYKCSISTPRVSQDSCQVGMQTASLPSARSARFQKEQIPIFQSGYPLQENAQVATTRHFSSSKESADLPPGFGRPNIQLSESSNRVTPVSATSSTGAQCSVRTSSSSGLDFEGSIPPGFEGLAATFVIADHRAKGSGKRNETNEEEVCKNKGFGKESAEIVSFVQQKLHSAVLRLYSEHALEASLSRLDMNLFESERLIHSQNSTEVKLCPQRKLPTSQNLPTNWNLDRCNQHPIDSQRLGCCPQSAVCVGLPVGKVENLKCPLVLANSSEQSISFISSGLGKPVTADSLLKNEVMGSFGQRAEMAMTKPPVLCQPAVEDEPPPPGVEDHFTARQLNAESRGCRGNQKLNESRKVYTRTDNTSQATRSPLESIRPGPGIEFLTMIRGKLLTAVKKNYCDTVLSAAISEGLGCWMSEMREKSLNKLPKEETLSKSFEVESMGDCRDMRTIEKGFLSPVRHPSRGILAQMSPKPRNDASGSRRPKIIRVVSSPSIHKSAACKTIESSDASQTKFPSRNTMGLEMLCNIEREEFDQQINEISTPPSKSSSFCSGSLESSKESSLDSHDEGSFDIKLQDHFAQHNFWGKLEGPASDEPLFTGSQKRKGHAKSIRQLMQITQKTNFKNSEKQKKKKN